jgi:transcriptional regulator with XRE-family HTH domain
VAGETFGEVMRRLRIVRGLSLRTLGAKAHLDAGHPGKIENGKRSSSNEVARALDEALDAVGVLVAVAVIGRPDAERMVAVPPADERIPWSPSPN